MPYTSNLLKLENISPIQVKNENIQPYRKYKTAYHLLKESLVTKDKVLGQIISTISKEVTVTAIMMLYISFFFEVIMCKEIMVGLTNSLLNKILKVCCNFKYLKQITTLYKFIICGG